MTPDLEALARRAVACKGWRWMPGMRWRFDVPAHAKMWSRYEGADAATDDGEPAEEAAPSRRGLALPDLSDPATVGCLLALVRDAWGDPRAVAEWFDPHWKVISRAEGLVGCLAGRGATEAAALVAALERAP